MGIHKWIKSWNGSIILAARAIGCTPDMMGKMRRCEEPVPLGRALQIEAHSNGDIPADYLIKWSHPTLAKTLKKNRYLHYKSVNSTEQTAFLVHTPLLPIEKKHGAFCMRGHPNKNSTRPLIIDENDTLLFGVQQLEFLQKNESSQAHALVIDLTRLLKEGTPIVTPYPLTILERMAIGLALQFKLSHWENGEKATKKYRKQAKCGRNCDHIFLKKEVLIAKLCGIGSKDTYFRVKRIIEKGTAELIDALNTQRISIYRASEIARLPSSEQAAALAQLSTLKMEKQP